MNFLSSYDLIPPLCMEGLLLYLEKRIKPGSFLTAILKNNLKESVQRADESNVLIIPIYVSWLYNYAPSEAWGSPEKFEKWLSKKEGS